ncbi:MAG: formylglycine-generating enzyme family protein [Paludibacteraceae bacterium]|nr:formylglycine-generating enzyme family protein [Paludibacteraceae bacterium]MBQ9100283.1 formylglycine-generating enzyme family protein [Paludibacteraceae bacterium]
MRKLFLLLLLVLSSCYAFAEKPSKERGAASKKQAAQQTQPKQPSAYAQDQINRKKAMLNFKMIFVEGGSFTMGCTAEQGEDCVKSEKPAHPVFVRSYAISKNLVTQRQWREVMGKNPSVMGDDDSPVTNVSWNDVQKFLKKLNNFLGKNYRLPTEAEWEYAARGGTYTNDMKYSGSNDIGEVGWYKNNSNDVIHPVGRKKGNELEINDMSGNIWEWCSDWYASYPEDTETELINPQGGETGTERVVRGGYYEGPATFCRVSCRNKNKPDQASDIIGFRLVEDRDGNE